MNTITTPDSPTFESLQLENVQLKAKLAWYEEQFRLHQHKKFSASSERFEDQGQLFNEAEAAAAEETTEEQEPETQTIEAHQRKKPVRKTLPEDLPRDIVELDISEEEKQCDCCGKKITMFGHESSCKLDIIPAQVKVIEFQRLKYRCECEFGVRTAPMPKLPIPKSIATWLHGARRRKSRKLDAIPKKKGVPQTKISKPAQVLNMIQTLYAIERRIKDKSVEERFQIRQSESRPVMDKLKKWLDRQQPKIAPQSRLGKAITYAQNQRSYLMRYLDSGLLDIDNNAAERAIKPFVIGRKNWLFAQCVDGAKASAVLYSLIETAKANGLEPYAWFRYVLSRVPQLPKGASVEYLLPMNLTPDDLKIADWWK